MDKIEKTNRYINDYFISKLMENKKKKMYQIQNIQKYPK